MNARLHVSRAGLFHIPAPWSQTNAMIRNKTCLSVFTVLKWLSDVWACRIPHWDLNEQESLPCGPPQKGHQKARPKFLWRRHQGDGFNKRLWSVCETSLNLQILWKEITSLVSGEKKSFIVLIWSSSSFQYLYFHEVKYVTPSNCPLIGNSGFILKEKGKNPPKQKTSWGSLPTFKVADL